MAQEYIAEHLLSLPIRFQDSIVEWTWNFYATFQFLFHVFFWAKNEVLMTLTTLENDVIDHFYLSLEVNGQKFRSRTCPQLWKLEHFYFDVKVAVSKF